MKKLLIIIDMINGFINFGKLADSSINQVTPAIIKHIKEAKSKGYPIIAFKDCHTLEDPEFKIFPAHCIKGTLETELIPELKIYEKDFLIIEKPTTNGFNTPEFKKYIKQNVFEEIIITGCCTEICVENFAVSLSEYFKANKINTRIIVPSNAVATFGSGAPQKNACAFTRMQSKGIIIN